MTPEQWQRRLEQAVYADYGVAPGLWRNTRHQLQAIGLPGHDYRQILLVKEDGEQLAPHDGLTGYRMNPSEWQAIEDQVRAANAYINGETDKAPDVHVVVVGPDPLKTTRNDIATPPEEASTEITALCGAQSAVDLTLAFEGASDRMQIAPGVSAQWSKDQAVVRHKAEVRRIAGEPFCRALSHIDIGQPIPEDDAGAQAALVALARQGIAVAKSTPPGNATGWTHAGITPARASEIARQNRFAIVAIGTAHCQAIETEIKQAMEAYALRPDTTTARASHIVVITEDLGEPSIEALARGIVDGHRTWTLVWRTPTGTVVVTPGVGKQTAARCLRCACVALQRSKAWRLGRAFTGAVATMNTIAGEAEHIARACVTTIAGALTNATMITIERPDGRTARVTPPATLAHCTVCGKPAEARALENGHTTREALTGHDLETRTRAQERQRQQQQNVADQQCEAHWSHPERSWHTRRAVCDPYEHAVHCVEIRWPDGNETGERFTGTNHRDALELALNAADCAETLRSLRSKHLPWTGVLIDQPEKPATSVEQEDLDTMACAAYAAGDTPIEAIAAAMLAGIKTALGEPHIPTAQRGTKIQDDPWSTRFEERLARAGQHLELHTGPTIGEAHTAFARRIEPDQSRSEWCVAARWTAKEAAQTALHGLAASVEATPESETGDRDESVETRHGRAAIEDGQATERANQVRLTARAIRQQSGRDVHCALTANADDTRYIAAIWSVAQCQS